MLQHLKLLDEHRGTYLPAKQFKNISRLSDFLTAFCKNELLRKRNQHLRQHDKHFPQPSMHDATVTSSPHKLLGFDFEKCLPATLPAFAQAVTEVNKKLHFHCSARISHTNFKYHKHNRGEI